MKIGKFDLSDSHTHVMGILNITPDSFSDGGKYNTIDHALYHAEEMIKDGAAILDIGGESTRPGYTKISDEEEIERVCPTIEAIRTHFDIPISVDTYKSKVANAAIQSGTDLINDIWGLQYDPMMAGVISEAKVSCCLMHNREKASYNDFSSDYLADMHHIIETALLAKIEKDKIILDPGVGFAKDTDQNLRVMKLLPRLIELGYPVLVGCSRKSMIGNVLNIPIEERLEGTVAISAYSAMLGASFVRVHDVKENVQAIRMVEAIMNA